MKENKDYLENKYHQFLSAIWVGEGKGVEVASCIYAVQGVHPLKKYHLQPIKTEILSMVTGKF